MKKLREYENADSRCLALEEELKIDLTAIHKAFTDDEKDVHCENLIGATIIPIGVAGPFSIRGEKVQSDATYVPLATTEGALVASVNRGVKALALSGGAHVRATKVGTSRAAVFLTHTLVQAESFRKWILESKEKFNSIAKGTSKHIALIEMHVQSVGVYTYVRFSYDTDDAMGMNMVTLATQAIADYVASEKGFSCISVAGNMDNDKKPSWINSFLGRGYSVIADATVSHDIIEKILKTDAEKIKNVWDVKCMIGSAISGSLGFNAHVANIVAALYAATGQDLAHVVEGSQAITTTKIVQEGLYISVSIPSVLVGTVGGGTKLQTKKEAISIMQINSAHELAEIVGATVLAGELSLLASQSVGSLACVHKKLGR